MSKDGVTDFGVGGMAVSVPLWLQQLELWAQAFVLIGGAVLLALRLVLAVRDLRRRRGADDGRHSDQM